MAFWLHSCARIILPILWTPSLAVQLTLANGMWWKRFVALLSRSFKSYCVALSSPHIFYLLNVGWSQNELRLSCSLMRRVRIRATSTSSEHTETNSKKWNHAWSHSTIRVVRCLSITSLNGLKQGIRSVIRNWLLEDIFIFCIRKEFELVKNMVFCKVKWYLL